MFTGIVEEMGRVQKIAGVADGYALTFSAGVVLEGTKLGDSIAVNGTCLTVTHFDAASFTVGVAPESLSRTNLGALKVGDPVNLERAVTPTTRLGGHYVQGHVDGVGLITSFRPDKDSLWVNIQAPPEIMEYIVPKGFIALDGVSLTVVDVSPDSFSVMLVAYTQQHIILPGKQAGYRVNIEVDILGKYVKRLIQPHLPQGVTARKLEEFGFGRPDHD